MCPLCSAHGDNYTSPWGGRAFHTKATKISQRTQSRFVFSSPKFQEEGEGGFRGMQGEPPYGRARRALVGAGLEGWRRGNGKTVDVCQGFRAIMATRPPPDACPSPMVARGEGGGGRVGFWGGGALQLVARIGGGGWQSLETRPYGGREGFGRGGSSFLPQRHCQTSPHLPGHPVNNGDPPSTHARHSPMSARGEGVGGRVDIWGGGALQLVARVGGGCWQSLETRPYGGREGFGRGGSGLLAEDHCQIAPHLPGLPGQLMVTRPPPMPAIPPWSREAEGVG